MLRKSHQCNELDGNMNPSSAAFGPQPVIGLWPEARISRSTQGNWNKQQQILVSFIMMSDVHSSPAWCYMPTTSHPVRYFPSRSLSVRIPRIEILYFHHKNRTWKVSWEMRVGITNLQFIRNFPTWFTVWCTDNKDEPVGVTRRVKRRPAAVPISPEARGGNGFTLDWEGFRLVYERIFDSR